MRKSILVFMAGASFILSGCFTRDQPFYEESQIVQMPRLEGAYQNISVAMNGRSDGASWFMAPSPDHPGKYKLTILESGVTATLLATLFRVGTNLFLDLYPLTDSGVYRVAGAPTVTEAVRGAMYKPLHVVWKVELSDEGVSYSFPYGNGVMAALRQAPELKSEPTEAPARILLPGTPQDAQKYLLRFKEDASVFNYKGRLVRRKGDAQQDGPANGSQPTRSETNRAPGAAGSRR